MAPADVKSPMPAAAPRLSRAVSTFIEWIGRAEPVYGIAGPIFERELRVSARRRRNYVLRVCYLVVLGGFVGLVWLSTLTVPFPMGGRTRLVYWMPEAGRVMTTELIWFEFIGLQLIALVMLSTSIGEEVYHRTLGVLLTTPINSVHIVLGKFLGKMLQVVLLLAVGLPLVMVIRVLGGTTLEFVLAGTGITLTTAALAGALSMLFSITSRVAPLVILKAVVAMLVLFLLLPLVWVTWAQGAADPVLVHGNPYVAMAAATEHLFSPGAANPVPLSWGLHCLAMLAMTVLVLAICVLRVRRAALRQLTGEAAGWPGAWWQRRQRTGARPAAGGVCSIRGSPIVWREARRRMFKGRLRSAFGVALVLAVLGVTYWLVGWSALRDSGSHTIYAILLLGFGCMATSVVAATGIPAEKESGTWPILLATPLDNQEIALAKALGAMRRCIPAWIPLTVHVAVFGAAGLIHPVAIPLVAVIVLGNALLLAGTGVFWGVILRRTATAAIANLLMCLGVWVMLPVVFTLGCGVFLMMLLPPTASILFLHPAMQVGVVMEGASGEHASANPADLRFVWPFGEEGGFAHIDVLALGAVLLAVAAIYFWVGWLFFRSAAKRVRRKVF